MGSQDSRGKAVASEELNKGLGSNQVTETGSINQGGCFPKQTMSGHICFPDVETMFTFVK